MDTLDSVQIQKPEWKCPNTGYNVTDKPIITNDGREHYLIHWYNPDYEDEYIDVSYLKMSHHQKKG